MEAFWQTLLPGLIIISVAGAAFLAYHDPRIFLSISQRLAVLLMGSAMFVMLGFAVYQFGWYSGINGARDLTEGLINEPTLDINTPILISACLFAGAIYVFFLNFISQARASHVTGSEPRGPDDGPKP